MRKANKWNRPGKITGYVVSAGTGSAYRSSKFTAEQADDAHKLYAFYAKQPGSTGNTARIEPVYA